MPSPNQATPAGTDPVANSEGAKAVLPPRMDQALFWQDVRHGLLWIVTVMTVGGGAVLFLTMPRHVQAMTIYGVILAGCVSLIIAQMRRKHGR